MNTDAILQLRRESGASLSACKQALQVSGGDVSLARTVLQKQRTDEVEHLRSATGLGHERCQQLLDEWGSVERALRYLKEEQRRAEALSSVGPRRAWPTQIRTLEEIWRLQDPGELVYELENYVSHKRFARRAPLSTTEHVFSLLASMSSWIEAEGFQDLFYQQWSLTDCHVVEHALREMGAERLARLLEEASTLWLK